MSFGVVLVVVGIGVALFRWKKGFYPASTMIIEDPPIQHNGLEAGQARFMMFYTTWCPWCKKAQAPWRSFQQQVTNMKTKYGGHRILFETINAEVDKGKSALYKIAAYPTIKVETTEKVVQFQGVPDPMNFDAFLRAVLGEPTTE